MTRWIDPQPIDVPLALCDAVGGHPLVAETLARRGVLAPGPAHAFLDPGGYTPAPPTDLPGLEAAVQRLRQAQRNGEKVAIWGDFDADGQTSTALLLETLRALGVDVVAYIPSRQQGHGLHEPALERLVQAGAGVILTCDTGVTAHEATARANDLGADVIITDHHVPGPQLPPALTVVDPHFLDPGHPLESLTGVGVAYELALALDPAAANQALDLVALGTVADVGTLTGDNRYLVQRGLETLRTTQRPGLLAVYHTANLRAEGLSEEHIGFVLAPRLNALGRLADAAHGVELLTSTDPVRARALATEVEGLNAQRQWLTKQITAAALAQVEREPALLHAHQALVLSHPTWPGGIVGIVAGRLAERFAKPAVLITAPEGKLARGSGRSIPGVNLVAALDQCAHLLQGYGGHPGAAGFSLEAEQIPQLRIALSRAVAAQADDLPEPALNIDAYLELPDLTLDLVADLGRLAPFGPGNPSLTLAVRDLGAVSKAPIGRTGEHLRVTVEDAQDRSQTVFWWNGADQPLPKGRFDLALSVRANDFRGVNEIQVEWLDARPLEPEAVELAPAPAIEIIDYREVSNPDAVLRALLKAEDVQVWAEGEQPAWLPGSNRRQLAPGPNLAIWTLPPGPHELRAALDTVEPETLYLFAGDTVGDEAAEFLVRLAGLSKFALSAKEGQVELAAAAAATTQREQSIEAGLECLEAMGQVRITARGETWHIEPGPGYPIPCDIDAARARVDDLLAEIAAYRTYLRHAPPGALVR